MQSTTIAGCPLSSCSEAAPRLRSDQQGGIRVGSWVSRHLISELCTEEVSIRLNISVRADAHELLTKSNRLRRANIGTCRGCVPVEGREGHLPTTATVTCGSDLEVSPIHPIHTC